MTILDVFGFIIIVFIVWGVCFSLPPTVVILVCIGLVLSALNLVLIELLSLLLLVNAFAMTGGWREYVEGRAGVAKSTRTLLYGIISLGETFKSADERFRAGKIALCIGSLNILGIVVMFVVYVVFSFVGVEINPA